MALICTLVALIYTIALVSKLTTLIYTEILLSLILIHFEVIIIFMTLNIL